jgi:hypothetical protein
MQLIRVLSLCYHLLFASAVRGWKYRMSKRKRRGILIVDDEPEITKLLALFEDRGYEAAHQNQRTHSQTLSMVECKLLTLKHPLRKMINNTVSKIFNPISIKAAVFIYIIFI